MATEPENNQAQTNNEFTPARPEKVTFTEAQQLVIDRAIKEAQGRSAREVRAQAAELAAKVSELESELAAAKAASPDLDGVQRAVQDLHQENRSLREIVADQQLDRAIDRASRGRFVDIGQVRQLTARHIKFDPTANQAIVVDDAGQKVDITLDDYFTRFAERNPHMTKADVKSGTGAYQAARSNQPGTGYDLTKIFGSGSDARLANEIGKRDPKLYSALRARARAEGLIG